VASQPLRAIPNQEFSTRDEERMRTANQPLSTGFELALLEEA
jgi:hypothetical protein